MCLHYQEYASPYTHLAQFNIEPHKANSSYLFKVLKDGENWNLSLQSLE